jgi:hypothetical protein
LSSFSLSYNLPLNRPNQCWGKDQGMKQPSAFLW